jgi:hypothetical protein
MAFETNRGTIDIDQHRPSILSGGTDAVELVSTDAAAKTAGNIGIWDDAGNLIDGGIAGGPITVNGSATVLVNNVAVSYDDTVTVNGA